MADITGTLARPAIGQSARNLSQLVTLRLVTGYTLLVVSLIGLLGGNWDIQWHAVVGRDRTFTPPHDMILTGIALAGIVALVSILIETSWARQSSELAQNSTDFLGILRSSLGSYFVGFGAVCSAVAFPLDTYWHSLYGIDVSLWAPFHTMIYMGGVLSSIGTIYILLSAAHLAQGQHQQRQARLGYVGVMIALGILLSKMCTFLFPALQQIHTLNLGFGPISIFPLLLSATVAFVCIFAVRVVRWPGAATLTIIVLLAVYLLVSAFVPPMMKLLVQIEHEVYLARASTIGSRIVPLLGQSPLFLLSGLCVDGILWFGKRAHWSLPVLNWGTALSATVSTTLVASLTLIAAARGHFSITFVLALALGIIGGLVGSWLSMVISQTVQGLKG